MGGSGKTQTSTQQVQIPPEVLARYTAANDAAATAAARPFQSYSSDPSAFVAPMSATQNAGVAATNAAAGQAQPSFADAQGRLQGAQSSAAPYNDVSGQLIGSGLAAAQPLNQAAQAGYSSALAGAQPYNAGATNFALAGSQAVNPTDLNGAAISKYMSPYLQSVLGGTAAQLQQDNAVAQSGALGNTIRNGGFGGDRGGIAAANLAGQQRLANSQIYSGILNQGYGQALGAAQQQQGVGLGAAQANRAALTGAGEQLANIGNLNYTQGSGTATNFANLGQQEYGQGLGAAQAVQGLGNQVFGQGVTTAEQEAGLGAAAQSAALQGAQAQLAAGQVEQQTEQAGKTALYNQFLQQQSYPFQTAQFLANVAEGTGSLSGSTTTTTQPGGFFSDKRLKEDIKKIGKTFDGQIIYSFKYKGDPRTQVGLMAQDVEKKHPDAVGESQGYKTVDYDKATDDASKRGHFAGGGAPILPGLSGADMSALLAAQEQMYAPFSQTGGLYGGQATGQPRGGSSYVPQATLPVSHLAVAGGLAPQKSGLESAKEIADVAAKAAPYAQKGEDWLKDKWAARNDNTASANENDLATGGLVPAKRYASGGMPYDVQTGLDIPDEKPDNKLQTAGDLPGQKSGLSNAKDAAGTVLDIAKLAAMVAGMKRGGRAGFAGGGSPFDDDTVDFATPSDGGGDGWKARDFSDTPGGRLVHAITNGIANRYREVTPSVVRDQAERYADGNRSGMGALAADGSPSAPRPSGMAALTADTSSGDSSTSAPYVGTPIVHMKTTAPVAGVAPRRPAPSGGLSPAVAATDAELPTITASQSPSLGGLAPPPANQDIVNTLPATPPPAPGLMSRVGSAIKDNVGDYASGLKRGDAQNWLPLLAGIAAAGTAPTVHPGVALAAGLGAGAQSYMGTKKSLADVARTQAETGNIGAHATATQQGNAINYYKLAQAGIIKADPAGTIIDPATGTHYSSAQSGEAPSVIPGGAPAPTFKYLGSHAQEALPKSAHQFVMDTPGFGITPNEGNIATSNKIINDTYQAAGDAQTAKQLQNEQAAAILSQSRGGVLSQGALAPVFQPYVEKWNSLMTDMGHPDLVVTGLGDQQIAHKLQVGQAAAQATTSGQHAYQALSDLTSLSPGGGLDPKAAATLMAQNAVLATKSIDQRNALEEAKQHAPNGNYEAQDIMAAFDHDNPPAVYNAMRDAVASIYQNPAYATIHQSLAKPGTPEYTRTINTLNAYGAQHGIPNFARVFTGG